MTREIAGGRRRGGQSSFNFNNFGFVKDTNLKFYTSVEKGFKLKFRKFWGLIPIFVKITMEKLVRSAFLPSPSLMLNRVKNTEFRSRNNSNTFKLWQINTNALRYKSDSSRPWLNKVPSAQLTLKSYLDLNI